MTSELSFPHHNYKYAVNEGRHEFIPSSHAAGIEKPTADDVPEVGTKLRKAGVSRVMLIHGTFAGDDVLGLMRELRRVLPGAADALKTFGKRIFDQVAGDVGNYTLDFAEQLASLINHDHESSIPVDRFLWSGENHHIGRAGGAIRLLDQLLREYWSPKDRILVWAHSHGGNLLALMSNLVGGDKKICEAFFKATQSHYRDPVLGQLTLPAWERVKEALAKGGVHERLPQLDVVGFGVPPRYRWNNALCANLLHFVQHRSLDEKNPTKACLPSSIQDIASATGGDYVQQLGIGGTDFLHSVVAFRSWNSERRLRRMLESSIRRRDLPRNLLKGHRVALDGQTLLIDYPDEPAKWNQTLLGHGVYTRPEWLPFHLNQITDRIYSN